jgi:putative heme-binding domain-containing protein
MKIGKLVGAMMLLLPLGWLSVAGGQGSGSTKQYERELNDPKFIAEGAKLFAPTCGSSYCHGTGGVGGGAPTLRGKSSAAYLFRTISNGIPNTSMLSFKSELTEEQIWKLVAFIMSTSNSASAEPGASAAPKGAIEVTAPVKASGATGDRTIVGNIQAGRVLFFESAGSKSCRACHSFGGEGTPIGPDLSKIGSRSAKELFLSIILARATKDPRYVTHTLTLRNGDKIVGVKEEEDAESIRVYDVTELPAVLRTVQKADVAKVETSNESVMPKDYASTYSLKQLLDLVTFLKSSQPESPVTLKDLFQ